jgi:hypothetical protein
MKSSMQMQDAFLGGVNPASHNFKPSPSPQPVFSPAVRFAPEEPSLFRIIRSVAYWAATIAILVAMARTGFSHLSHVWSEPPSRHAVK